MEITISENLSTTLTAKSTLFVHPFDITANTIITGHFLGPEIEMHIHVT